MATPRRITFLLIFVGCATPLPEERPHRELETWQAVQAADTLPAYSSFVQANPTSLHAAEAKSRMDELTWQSAKGLDRRDSYAAYIDAFPSGAYLAQAQKSLEDVDWRFARRLDTADAYRHFLLQHPGAAVVEEARQLAEERLWSIAFSGNDSLALREYLLRYPTGEYASEALAQLERPAWSEAEGADCADGYRWYLATHPEGEHAAAAADRLAWLNAAHEGTQESVSRYLDAHPAGEFAELARTNLELLRKPLPESIKQVLDDARIVCVGFSFAALWPRIGGRVYVQEAAPEVKFRGPRNLEGSLDAPGQELLRRAVFRDDPDPPPTLEGRLSLPSGAPIRLSFAEPRGERGQLHPYSFSGVEGSISLVIDADAELRMVGDNVEAALEQSRTGLAVEVTQWDWEILRGNFVLSGEIDVDGEVVRLKSGGIETTGRCEEARYVDGTICEVNGLQVRYDSGTWLRTGGLLRESRRAEAIEPVAVAGPPSPEVFYISGVVLSPDGEPGAKMQVVGRHADGKDRTLYEGADENGVFRLGPLRAGEWDVEACGGGFAPSKPVRTTAGADNVELQLRLGGTITALAVDGATRQPTRCMVRIKRTDVYDPTWTYTGAPQGAISFNCLLPGVYVLSAVTDSGFVGHSDYVEVAAGETVDAGSIALQQGARLRVHWDGKAELANCVAYAAALPVAYANLSKGEVEEIVVPPGEIEVRWEVPRTDTLSLRTLSVSPGDELDVHWNGDPW